MRWRDSLNPVLMDRVALLAPASSFRELLVVVADEGTVQLDAASPDSPAEAVGATATAMVAHEAATQHPVLSASLPDLEACRAAHRMDLVAGEAILEGVSAGAVSDGTVRGLTGWMPRAARPALADRLAPVGGVVVPLRRPPGSQPPTMLSEGGVSRQFDPLVTTYATVPYEDVNPSLMAGLAYVVMFGMMFADVGHGLILLGIGLAARTASWPVLSRLRRVWLFITGAGVSSVVFGALYGEFFGPTEIIPVLWLSPMEEPITLLVVGVMAGGVLLSGAYVLAIVNRFREGGWQRALYAPSGIAGGAMFLGLAAGAAAFYVRSGWLLALGLLLAGLGLTAAYIGLLAAAGFGAAGVMEAAVELVDLVIRLGSNLVSFARLAAFGLTHAALGSVVWQATTALGSQGGAALVAAGAVFLVGNALAFLLEGLIAAIQALRLEYYELFSRVFETEGQPFRPWHLPIENSVPAHSLE